MNHAYSVDEVFQYESYLINSGRLTMETLLERASSSLFNVCKEKIDAKEKTLIISGKGYNGADALRVATKLAEIGRTVSIYPVFPLSENKPLTQKAYQNAVAAGVEIQNKLTLSNIDVVIDGMLGIGCRMQLPEHLINIIKSVNQAKLNVISIDVPSGLNADTGIANVETIRASTTICLLLRKRGLYTADADDYTGDIIFEDCGIVTNPNEVSQHPVQIINRHDMTGYKPIKSNVQKYDFGKTLVIGGCDGMQGAVVLCGHAAYRAGTGLVKISAESSEAIVGSIPDYLTQSWAELKGQIHQERCSSIIIGPGLGRSQEAGRLLEEVLKCKQPKVVDADGLRLLASKQDLVGIDSNTVLTPHAGEAADLLSCSIKEVEGNRFQAAARLEAKYGCSILLKGPGNIVISSGKSYIVGKACPALAVAGSGDVLAGMIGSFLSQGYDSLSAIINAVQVHFEIGQALWQENGGRGAIASDMIAMIPHKVNKKKDQ